ncbi:hypothetical protein K9N08_02115 [Candidatus Gracilibacteria bacterium]|nr:hypothetical protein [Candidatus Gracilibacteria bacterium]MCF7856332.1 hypothetical protein [Candidatus Gracilibacteria bacterium]MCF7896721.1 hypothetical protein [Candidatus Gracilibacteria bacterium]
MSLLIEKIRHHKYIWMVAITAILLLVFSAVSNSNKLSSSVMGSIDTSTYQSIHLDTGKTYFGKVIEANEEFVTIKDVFYFLDDSKKKLVKRGEEAQSGNDSLTLNRSHILTTENLSRDGAVVQAILKYNKNKN